MGAGAAQGRHQRGLAGGGVLVGGLADGLGIVLDVEPVNIIEWPLREFGEADIADGSNAAEPSRAKIDLCLLLLQ